MHLYISKKVLNFKKQTMSNKNYTLLLVSVFMLVSTLSFAQMSDVTNQWKDSSKVAAKNSAQFTEFSKNAYIYPAKPRSMWEMGVSVGLATLKGDLNDANGIGASLTFRKSISHVFSLRPYFSAYFVEGTTPFPPSTNTKDFKTKSLGLGIDAIASLSAISSYRGNTKTDIYLLAGLGFLSANVEQKNSAGAYQMYYNPNINGPLMNFGYTNNGKHAGSTVVVPNFNIGAGIAFKLSDRTNLAVETKATITNYDYFDGVQGISSNAYDAWMYNSLRLNINLGSKDKNVQPLNWINPNNYVYSELTNPDHLKKNLKIKLDDADGDGITDQFDLEPNTPAGVAVDSRGRALDSDGDGVPDYKDKELLTRQECFPVNTDGVGSCPESACCKESREKIAELQKVVDGLKESGVTGTGACSMNNLPSIVFKSGGASLNRDNMRLLDAVATQMKDNPSCKVKVLGHPEANKSSQQKAYDRVDAIIKYLVEKQGISENRFIFAYDSGSGDGKTIDLQGTNEVGPNTVPAPAPHLKGKQNY